MGKQRSKKGDEYKVQHNTFFEETFGMPGFGVAFLKKMLPKELKKHLEIEKLTVEKPYFRDDHFRETRPDIVYKVPIRGTGDHISFYVIVEHKSQDDHSAIFQLWKYICQLCVQDVKKRLTDSETKQRKTWPKHFRLSPVIPIILHHGGKPFTGKTQLADLFHHLSGAEKYLPRLQAILVDLSVIEENKLPRDPNAPELHVVLLIMKAIFSKSRSTLKNKFKAILKELQPYSQVPKYRELIRKLWYYMAYNAEPLTETDAEELETDIRETTGDNNMPTLAQIYIEKGEVKNNVESILAILEDNFGEVPQATKDVVTKITDLAILRRLTILAGKCKSLAEFAKALK